MLILEENFRRHLEAFASEFFMFNQIQYLLSSLSICRRYDEITDRITSKLSTTDELVELNQYLRHTSEVTVHKLHHEIEEAVKRLDFLLDYATLPGTNVLYVMCVCKYCVYGRGSQFQSSRPPALHIQHVSLC